ncbi:hypothetical protein LOAG_18322 [Loa loa]|uniref:Serine/threonine-protein kinase DDB_G0282963 n=1 Tax=Loa loa TaxID=7209 RepID=A0A1I7VKL7_LOALO|nr:hypothetical protein LOAG_18322 [Loa loa]EJD74359.1 hypothetical protein LOAG_18322 [Loa loa]
MFSKSHLKSPKQKQQQRRHQQQQQQQQQRQQRQQQPQKQQQQQQRQERQQQQLQKQPQQYHQQKCQLQQAEQLQTTIKKDGISINSGRIGERLVIRTTTLTGQRLRYTVTRPFLSAEPRLYHSKYHSNDTFHQSSSKNSIKNHSVERDRTLSSSSINDTCEIFTEKFSTKTNNGKSKSDIEFIISKHPKLSIDENGDKHTGYCSFAQRFREMQSMTYGYPKKSISTSQSGITPNTSHIPRINYRAIITCSSNNIDKNSLPVFEKSRQQVNQCDIPYKQTQSLSPLIKSDKGMF